MKRIIRSTEFIRILICAVSLLAHAAATCAQETHADIEYICQRERQKVESMYSATQEDLKAYEAEHSLERLLLDPSLRQAADEKTKELALKVSAKWPPKMEIDVEGNYYSVPITEPWLDSRFDYNRHFNVFLRQMAQEQALTYQRQVELARIESRQAYGKAIKQLEKECQRNKDLQADALKREAEKTEVARREKQLAETVSREQEKKRQREILNGKACEQAPVLSSLINKLDNNKRKDAQVLVPPGRFDAQRKRWGRLFGGLRYHPGFSSNRSDSIIVDAGKTK